MVKGRPPPDGVYGDFPYWVRDSGEIDVLIEGRVIRLNNVDEVVAAASNCAEITKLESRPPKAIATVSVASSVSTAGIPNAHASSPPPLSQKKSAAGKTILWIILTPIVGLFCLALIGSTLDSSTPTYTSNSSSSTRTSVYSASVSNLIVDLLNSQYGGICTAKLEGWVSKTLRLDWTASTNRLHVIRVFAEVASVRERLYEDGVRYFKFPNDAGGYNVIDWKTGSKTSVSERARYYFP